MPREEEEDADGHQNGDEGDQHREPRMELARWLILREVLGWARFRQRDRLCASLSTSGGTAGRRRARERGTR